MPRYSPIGPLDGGGPFVLYMFSCKSNPLARPLQRAGAFMRAV